MKKLISYLLVVSLMLVTFIGCSKDVPLSAEDDKKIVIGVSMNSADEYRSSWLNSFKDLAERKGYTVYSTNADTDPSKQISDVESLLAKKPDIMIMHCANADGSVAAVEAVAAAGIPCVLFDLPVNTDKYTTFISDEQYLNGIIQGEYVNQWLKEDESRVANVGYIVGMYSMEAAMPRREGFFNTCTEANKLSEKEGSWSADNAMKITEDWLQAYSEMNVFACMNDDMAIGCIQALQAAGKNMDDVLVLGIDGTDVAKTYLESGELDCTASRDVNLETSFTLRVCEDIMNGKTVEKKLQPKAITALTKDNINK